jgi:hypothetical protein
MSQFYIKTHYSLSIFTVFEVSLNVLLVKYNYFLTMVLLFCLDVLQFDKFTVVVTGHFSE